MQSGQDANEPQHQNDPTAPYQSRNQNDPTAPTDPYRSPPQTPPPAPPPPYDQPPYDQPAYAEPGQPPYGPAPGYPEPGYGWTGPAPANNSLGTLALVFGIAGLPLGLCCVLFGAPFSITALVLGALGKSKADRGEAANPGQAVAGLILGAIGVGLTVIRLLLGLGLSVDWSDFTR
jgi:hypothetical protein